MCDHVGCTVTLEADEFTSSSLLPQEQFASAGAWSVAATRLDSTRTMICRGARPR